MEEPARPAPPWRGPSTGTSPDGGGAGERWRGPPQHWHHGPPWLRGPRTTGPLRRERDNGMAGGVAAGIAARTGIDVTAVRTVFIVASLASGFGVAAYVAAWLLVPATGADANIASKAMTDRRGIALAAAVGSLLVVVMLTAAALGAGRFGQLAWPAVLSAGGIVLIWRNAPAEEQAVMRRLTKPLSALISGHAQPPAIWRLVIGGAALLAGLGVLLSGHPTGALVRPLGGVILVVAAIVILLGPWWLRIARDLMVERQARARAEERADMAARIHDSVLQTLALIQRRADSQQQVIQLARAQERELRSWLFEGRAPGETPATSLAGGVRLIQQEVEAQHGVAVEAVTVGDCDLDEDLNALLAAAREATVNAAKWSGAAVVSVFAEVEAAQVSVFVRDRGQGFDPSAVPSDRKGLAESVHARMARRGGTAAVRSNHGQGTEVSLTMPRPAGQRQPSRA